MDASSGQAPTTATRHRRITRARVLDAAEKVFGARGFHAASMQAIASEAGYTTGALYSSFENKDDLFLAVLERRRTLRENRWREALADGIGSPAGALAMGATIVPNPHWYATLLEFTARASRDEEHRNTTVPLLSGYSSRREFLEEVLTKASPPDAPLPVERLGQILWALILGFGESWWAEPDLADPTLFADALAVLFGTPSPQRRSTEELAKSSGIAGESHQRPSGGSKGRT